MKPIFAVFLICCAAAPDAPASAKDACTYTWGKGNYKTFKQVQGELGDKLTNGKIIRLSLCSAGTQHYFQVTILETSGKVRTLEIPAR